MDFRSYFLLSSKKNLSQKILVMVPDLVVENSWPAPLFRCLVLAEADTALAQPRGARGPGLLYWLGPLRIFLAGGG